MKVILQQDVKGQGKKGQMIEASDGYARNFLLPRKLAVPATAENVNTMKMQEKAKKAQEAAEKAEAARRSPTPSRPSTASPSPRPRSSRTSPSRPSAAMS